MAGVICPIGREVDVYVAISRGREMATSLGFDDIDRTRIEIVILELTRNILAHAGTGELHLNILEEDGRRGMVVQAQDRGPGIADIDLAFTDGWTSGKGLGLGLSGARRLVDEFDLTTEVGRGTTVTVTKWAR